MRNQAEKIEDNLLRPGKGTRGWIAGHLNTDPVVAMITGYGSIEVSGVPVVAGDGE